MDKKNIDQLFKEQLKDFKEVPDDKVWTAIEASLDKKKRKRRVFPIWWKLGGAAAALALLFYVLTPFESDDTDMNTSSPSVVDTDSEVKATDSESNVSNKNETSFELDSTMMQQEAIVEVPESELLENKTSKSSNVTATSPKTKNVGLGTSQAKKTEIAAVDKTKEVPPASRKSEIALADSPNQAGDKDLQETLRKSNRVSDETIASAVTTKEKDDSINSKKENALEGIAAVTDKVEDLTDTKKSLYEEIEDQAALDAEVENSLKNRWSVGPSVAPVFFNAIGEGSPIHSSFVPNSKSGNTNLSYGVNVAYEIGKKLSVRSGVHKVDFGFTTNDILFSASLSNSTNEIIDNITYSSSSRNLVVQSKATSNNAESLALADAANSVSDVFGATPSLDGRMVQQFGYIEVPLEVNYKLLDRKIGVHLTGGISSLFLLNNSIALESNGLVTEIGEANNINNLNFSTNIGVGFNYKFSKRARLNIEPVFKYQLNTFSETSGTFRPYSVGVYSGLSYKF